MQKWEYMEVSFVAPLFNQLIKIYTETEDKQVEGKDMQAAVRLLCLLGNQGWEVVSQTCNIDAVERHYWTLKRPKE
jgi:hypothetical protein